MWAKNNDPSSWQDRQRMRYAALEEFFSLSYDDQNAAL
jgi:hypothetical protein